MELLDRAGDTTACGKQQKKGPIRDCHFRGIADGEEGKGLRTCASCCTLACSLAGDCFISSASLSLNFLNILARGWSEAAIGRDKARDKAPSEVRAPPPRRRVARGVQRRAVYVDTGRGRERWRERGESEQDGLT